MTSTNYLLSNNNLKYLFKKDFHATPTKKWQILTFKEKKMFLCCSSWHDMSMKNWHKLAGVTLCLIQAVNPESRVFPCKPVWSCHELFVCLSHLLICLWRLITLCVWITIVKGSWVVKLSRPCCRLDWHDLPSSNFLNYYLSRSDLHKPHDEQVMKMMSGASGWSIRIADH